MAYTNTMRYTGLSGVDTASMVDAMMKVEAIKYNNLYKANITNSYKQEAYRNVGNELVDIQSSKFDILAPNSLVKKSSYLSMETSVKDKNGNDSNAITVTTGGNSKEFEADIRIDSLAEKDRYIVTSSGAGKSTAKNDMDMSSVKAGDKVNFTVDGVTKEITFTESDVTKMNSSDEEAIEVLNNKLNESFGSGTTSRVNFGLDDSGKVQLSATTGHSLKITESGYSDLDLGSALGFDSGTVTTQKTSTTTMGEYFGTEGETTVSINGAEVSFNENTTVDDFMKQVNATGEATAKYNSATGSMSFESAREGSANALNITSTTVHADGTTTSTNNTSESLGALGGVNQTKKASDAVIIVDGDEGSPITLDSNSYTLSDGTRLTFNQVTEEAVSVSSKQDNDYTASMVHEFVDSYNAILESIYSESKTERPKDSSGSYYDPLLPEESEELSTEEIEKWEENAKKGLLYNDSTLRSIEKDFRQAVTQPYKMKDGTNLYLSDLGITLNDDYAKGGLLVVDDAKLSAGIEKYGAENVADAFSNGFAKRTDEVLDNTVGMSGSLTQKVGLDSSPYYMQSNTMTMKMNRDQLRIQRELERLEDKENYYFRMFSKMEQAIQECDSQLGQLGLA